MIQFDPPRDVDTYVHRSGRTGRAGNKGVSVLFFSRNQARDIVRIERDLGHGFKFNLVGPPSIATALRAAAKTSANACLTVPDETAMYFKDAAADLLEDEDPQEIVARCLAAISRRSTDVQSRSLITGELGLASVMMSYDGRKSVAPGDVMYTVGKLARQSAGDLKFDSDVGKIQTQAEDGTAIFDLGVEDAHRLIKFCAQEDVDTQGAMFQLVEELEVNRDRNFGQSYGGRGGGGRGGGRGGYGGRGGDRGRGGYGRGGGGSYSRNSGGNERGGGSYRGNSGGYRSEGSGNYRTRSNTGAGYQSEGNRGRFEGGGYQRNSDNRYSGGRGSGGGYRSRNNSEDTGGW